MLRKAAVATTLVFIASSIWLFLAYSNGARTNDWPPVPADIQGNGVERTANGQTRGLTTVVKYQVDGVEYEAVVDEYLVGKGAEVYVNPSDPSEVVGKRGPTLQMMFRPIVVTGATGLFAIVLALIALSPKDD